MRFFAIRCVSQQGAGVSILLDKNDLFLLAEGKLRAAVVTDTYQQREDAEEIGWDTFLNHLYHASISEVRDRTLYHNGNQYAIQPGWERIVEQLAYGVYRHGDICITELQLQDIIQAMDELERLAGESPLHHGFGYFFRLPLGTDELYLFRQSGGWSFVKRGDGSLQPVSSRWLWDTITGEIDAEVDAQCEYTSGCQSPTTGTTSPSRCFGR